MLKELRATITAALVEADITALDYVGEAIIPPCALVVPGEPYIQGPGEGRSIPFRRVGVGVDVLLLVPRESGAMSASDQIDQLIEDAFRALKNHRIQAASRPGVVTVSGSKYVGSVLSIEALTEEP